MRKENKQTKSKQKMATFFFFWNPFPPSPTPFKKRRKKKTTLIKYTTLKIRNEEIHNDKRRKIRQNQNKLTSISPLLVFSEGLWNKYLEGLWLFFSLFSFAYKRSSVESPRGARGHVRTARAEKSRPALKTSYGYTRNRVRRRKRRIVSAWLKCAAIATSVLAS